MSDTDITPQEGMNPEPEVVEDTAAEETGETPEHTDERTKEETEEMVPKSKFNQVLARARKAEDALKAKSKPEAQTVTSNALTKDAVQEQILRASGMSERLVGELKAIAKVRGKDLIETQTDPLFLAVKDQEEREEKARKAALPASRGSGSVKKAKTFNTPGLTDEEHKALWREKNGR